MNSEIIWALDFHPSVFSITKDETLLFQRVKFLCDLDDFLHRIERIFQLQFDRFCYLPIVFLLVDQMIFLLQICYVPHSMQYEGILGSVSDNNMILWHELEYEGFVFIFSLWKFIVLFVENTPELFSKFSCSLFSSKTIVAWCIRDSWWCYMPLTSVVINKSDWPIKFLIYFIVSKVKVFQLRIFCIIIVEKFVIWQRYNFEISIFIEYDSTSLMTNWVFEWCTLQVLEFNQVWIHNGSFHGNFVLV